MGAMKRMNQQQTDPTIVTQERIRSRKCAEEWFDALRDESKGFKTKEAVKRFWGMLSYMIAEHTGNIQDGDAKSKPSSSLSNIGNAMGSPVSKTPIANIEDWEDALELCEGIIEKIDELPDRAQEFGESVGEKIRSISETIEQQERVSDRQLAAIQNMGRGVDKWLGP